ncbi:MAG: AraC family transcriptional regulator [Alphaproteobacteria bacterium]|nr:AraC family transcriptional regulator [Alphaproteobacteria bacterium]
MSVAADGASVRISSAALPRRERMAAMREWIGRKILHVELESVTERPFQLDLTVRMLPELALASASDFGLRSRRTRALMADSDDDVYIGINVAGRYIAEQLGHEVVLGPGDAVVTSCAEPGVLVHPRHGQAWGLKIPRAALAPFVGNVDDAIMRAVPRDDAILQMLSSYLGLLWQRDALPSPELRRAAAAHVHDLVALIIGATRDGAEIAHDRGVRAARLNAIKSRIIAELSNPGLRATAVAASEGISDSYVRKLFESEGTSFSDFVLAQRLARVHRLLTDSRQSNRSIASLAFSVGFGDVSYFNKTFRRRYGATPSEVRAGTVTTRPHKPR